MRLLAGLFLLTAPLAAAFHPVGVAPVRVFDPRTKAWREVAVQALYQPEPEAVRVRLAMRAGSTLNAQLQFSQLPGYGAWVDARRREGGAAWTALDALLGAVAGRPVECLTLGPVPANGPVEVLVGLRDGGRFELYAKVRGDTRTDGGGLDFDPRETEFAKTPASLAWRLLQPVARRQARRAAGRG